MIRRTQAGAEAFCRRDIFGTRIAATLATYGLDRDGVSVYVQQAGDAVTAVLSDAFSDGTLCCTSEADFDELREFVHFLGLQTLLCDKQSAESLGFSPDCIGHIMRYVHTERTPQADCITPDQDAFRYREVYDLLKACGFTPGEYDAWLGDFALRVRRGTANVLCVRQNDRAVSTASALFLTDTAVYLGAVGTRDACRGQGLGGDLVLRLAQCGKRAEILCRAHRVSFYESLGFTRNGEFALCHFSPSTNVFLP